LGGVVDTAVELGGQAVILAVAVEFVDLGWMVVQSVVVLSVVARTVVAESLAARSVVVALELAQSVIVGSGLEADLQTGLGIWYPDETFWLVCQLTLSVVGKKKSCVSRFVVRSILPDPEERIESQVQLWYLKDFCGSR
jgi:hypothetical protein